MDIVVIQSISIIIYKLSSLVAGLALSFMGYKLFMAGIWGSAGGADASFGDNRITLKKAAPGTFFVVVGAIVICVTLLQGLQYSGSNNQGCPSYEKPTLSD